MVKKSSVIISLLAVSSGLYCVNYPINFIKFPAVVSQVEPFIIFASGIFSFFLGIYYFWKTKDSFNGGA
jgi:hypothetical protein